MKAQNITLDINRLTTDELKVLAAMLYFQGHKDDCKAVNDRIAFLEGWMSEKQSKAYFEAHCA